MEIKNEVVSRSLKTIVLTLVGVMILLGIFQLGQFVGYRRAEFAFHWGDNYHRSFGGPRRGFLDDFRGPPGFTNAHGVFATILKQDGGTIIIKDKDDTEKTVLIDAETTIRRGRDSIRATELSVNDSIVIIGEPNQNGDIEAKLIRVFPRK